MKWARMRPCRRFASRARCGWCPRRADGRQDLWHTYKMLAIGDALSANTIRKVNHHLGWLLLLPHACMRRLSTLQTPSSINILMR